MTIDVADTLARITAEFRQAGDPIRAANEAAYLKSDLTFIGLTVPAVRQAAKTFRRQHPDLSHEDLVALADAFTGTDCHELRSFAIAILELFSDRLLPEDMARLERYLGTYNTWAHVDWLAAQVVGAVVRRFPAEGMTLRRWAVSPTMWVRRSALLALIEDLRRGGGALALFTDLALPMVAEKEFFIAKAIGWVLRDMSRKRPELVAGFLAQALSASGVTWREAVKYLPPALRERLEAARANAKAARGAKK
jgi:3-methyladenine DNA glycosylase AlkD